MAESSRPSHWRRGADSSEPCGDQESTFMLIDRARAGDAEALERLFARHQKPLQRWASGRLPRWARDISETEDLVQETLRSIELEPCHQGSRTRDRTAGHDRGAARRTDRLAVRPAARRNAATLGAIRADRGGEVKHVAQVRPAPRNRVPGGEVAEELVWRSGSRLPAKGVRRGRVAT
jgi:hypothetical protein